MKLPVEASIFFLTKYYVVRGIGRALLMEDERTQRQGRSTRSTYSCPSNDFPLAAVDLEMGGRDIEILLSVHSLRSVFTKNVELCVESLCLSLPKKVCFSHSSFLLTENGMNARS